MSTHPTPSSRRLRSFKWLIAGVSVVVAIVLCELLLRYSLFSSSLELGSQDPDFYARNLDEVWVYRHLFSANKRWTVGAGNADSSGETQIEFYKRWPTSLMPDAELGYVRKARRERPVPRDEQPRRRERRTTTRRAGRKIVFFGDSFVESAACSNDTLTAKIEKLTGIDTLNYGIGGYGLDQIYLYFQRVVAHARSQATACSSSVSSRTISAASCSRCARVPSPTSRSTTTSWRCTRTTSIRARSTTTIGGRPERFYLYYFLRGRLGYPVYRSMMSDTRGRAAAGDLRDVASC